MEGGIADCSVGTIVWVRRRNGSWWPGRILGPEELSASHLMSPRSGTPVKLLGREDASVDWYNLEKSKRVKAFRCGEFDACIERAEASQGILIKKREKYARREDAILHALELEKLQLETKHQKLGIVSNGITNKTPGGRRRGLNSFPTSDNYLRDDDPGLQSKFVNRKTWMFSRKAGSSRDEEDDLYVHKGKSSKQTGWTEYSPETLPRMRGLQDFGLRAAPTKKMLPESTWETSYKPVNNHVGSLSDSGHMMASPNHAGGSKCSLQIKRKRPQGGISLDSLVKKRDRRRPLVQVLQSSAKLPVPHSVHSGYDSGAVSMHGERDNMGAIFRAKRSRCMYLPADPNESLEHDGYPSEQMPNTETEFGTGGYLDHTGALPEEDTSSESDETGSDSSESDESDTDENTLADATPILLPGSKNCDPPAAHIPENFGEVEDDEKPGYIPQSHTEDRIMDVSADVGVSKWHMKGKRNIRNLPKRPMGPIGSADKCNGSIKGTSYERSGSCFKMTRTQRRSLYHRKEASHYAFDGVGKLERDGQDQLYGNQRYSFALQTKDRGRSQSSFNDSDTDSHQLSPSSRVQRPSWEEAYADHLGDDVDPMLINVELMVQAATYQGEHVPLVSLMSRLNGKAIIGHPVQIEILEDGSSGQIVTKYDAGLDESNAPPAVWKTARRSVMHRIPRPHPVPQNSDPESKPAPKRAYSGYFNHQARLAKKSISHAKRPLVPGKFRKKLSKKVNLSIQKTRTLSSLATEQMLGKFLKLSRQRGILDGLIKPDGGATIVACIPAKVVFSRLLEAIGGPTSASAHRARIASPANPP